MAAGTLILWSFSFIILILAEFIVHCIHTANYASMNSEVATEAWTGPSESRATDFTLL
jgi:hypothetical protein